MKPVKWTNEKLNDLVEAFAVSVDHGEAWMLESSGERNDALTQLRKHRPEDWAKIIVFVLDRSETIIEAAKRLCIGRSTLNRFLKDKAISSLRPEWKPSGKNPDGSSPCMVNLSGKSFGRWKVLELSRDVGPRGGKHGTRWRCVCDIDLGGCGTVSDVSGHNLVSGFTRSCGCLRVDVNVELKTTHGATATTEYVTWCGMLTRCENENDSAYKYYGERGIKVCERWHSFENFIEDMGVKPTPGHSIERKNVNGDYEPTNCVWATDIEQARNKRNTRWVTFGNETLCVAEWAERIGLSESSLRERLETWTVAQALTLPKGSRGKESGGK